MVDRCVNCTQPQLCTSRTTPYVELMVFTEVPIILKRHCQGPQQQCTLLNCLLKYLRRSSTWKALYKHGRMNTQRHGVESLADLLA